MDVPLQRYLRLLVVYLKPQWRKAILLLALLLASITLQLLNPQILRYFIDSAKENGISEGLVGIAFLFLCAGVANQIFAACTTYVGADVGWTATNLLRVDLASHCLKLDMGFHNDRTPGELIERIDGDITALSNFFSQFVMRIIGSLLVVIGVLALLYHEDWRAGVVMSLYAICAIYVLARAKDLAVSVTAIERESTARLYGFVEERLAGLDDLRANGGGRYTMQRMYGVLRHQFINGLKAFKMRSLLWVIIVGLFTLGDLIALGTGIYLFDAGAITLGTVYLFYQYTQLMAGLVEQITQQLQDLQKAGASIGRVEELLNVKSRMQDGVGAPLPDGPLAVEFDGASFGYGDAQVLKSLSFRLEPGKVLGLLGRTGSGKTTLTRLLFRLYDPTHGAIRVGGVDIRKPRMEELRGRVAMVTQEVQLFHATLRDNLTFFNREIPDEQIMAVIEELGLVQWLRSMPKGLDTMLTSGGGGLSAGEAQLLAFTRVFLHDPGLVILDEPSSRMDLATERLLERAMVRLLRNRTAIIIAHRLSTVSRADEIMILDRGAIHEHGSRKELAGNENSRFYSLLRTGLEAEAA